MEAIESIQEMHGKESKWFTEVVPKMQKLCNLPEERPDETIKVQYLAPLSCKGVAEGPIWHSAHNCFYYCDIAEHNPGVIFRLKIG